MMNEEIIGNLTTILKILIITFVPAAFLEQVDAGMLASVLTAIISFIFSILDAKYSNTYFNKKDEFSDEDISAEGV